MQGGLRHGCFAINRLLGSKSEGVTMGMPRSQRDEYGKSKSRSRSIALGVLDQSPIRSGHSPAEAIVETVELARVAERLGYRRYWVAEHHASDAFAGTAPEILVSSLAAVTSTMRIGTGGVMLNHYAPLKVAETFRVLEALYPGRIDMGIGRAPGGDSLSALALRQGRGLAETAAFADQAADLLAMLANEDPPSHPHPGVRAQPWGNTAPEPWMLGSSAHGAALAARFGCAFSFAHLINGPSGAAVMQEYRDKFRPSVWLAAPRASVCAFVLCADTEREARRLALSRDLWGLRISQQVTGPFPSVEEAEAQAYTRADRRLMAAGRSSWIVGNPEQVSERLLDLAADYDVEEILILTVCFDPAARRRSYELLSEAFDLKSRSRISGIHATAARCDVGVVPVVRQGRNNCNEAGQDAPGQGLRKETRVLQVDAI
jgi:luciferase family oxidoreductase group 1